ncbi:hypothetical protein KC19_2G059900 [Ceratodon purpureus]|uniref:Secreted protein n=1 Tax=Ceratodon purpureus TaxID=3225 RepID=A0A8T0IQM5_CERPU|nr:hypothetical protein KC19_2G059900 [Ceratodon purpureus]
MQNPVGNHDTLVFAMCLNSILRPLQITVTCCLVLACAEQASATCPSIANETLLSSNMIINLPTWCQNSSGETLLVM